MDLGEVRFKLDNLVCRESKEETIYNYNWKELVEFIGYDYAHTRIINQTDKMLVYILDGRVYLVLKKKVRNPINFRLWDELRQGVICGTLKTEENICFNII